MRRLLGNAVRLGLLILALPILALTLAATTGVGISQNIPPASSLAGGFVITLLPAFGLGALLGGRANGQIFGLWAWPLIVLLAIPAYFPGEREAATRDGLRYLTSMVSGKPSESWIDAGLELLAVLGPELPATPMAERVPAPEPVAADESPAIAAASPEPHAQRDRSRPDPSALASIPYEGEGNSMRIAVHVDGAEFGEELEMIFDTGATLTTLNRRTLELLDVPVPPDAPTVVLHTAAGEMEAPLALLDAVWLDGQAVEWVTVAVCEDCVEGSSVGLLGLNVSSHFRVAIDHAEQHIELLPQRGRRNRRLDIQPWLDLKATLSQWMDGRLEIEIQVENQSRRGIRTALVEVKCSEESFTVSLDAIPPYETGTTTSSLPWGSSCDQFEIKPLSANWNLDRF